MQTNNETNNDDRHVIVTFRADADDAETVRNYARQAGTNRSEILRDALGHYAQQIRSLANR